MNVRELRSQAKARKIPKYYKLGKAQLLSALGMSAEAKAHKSQATRRKAIAFNASKEGGDSSVKKALVKGRILRSVKRGLVAEEKKQGRKLTQEEKRTVATRALASEVKAIRSGTPEMKPKRGNGQKMTKATKSLTPDQHKQVAIDVKRIKESDRQGWIADGMAKGDETMLRSQARQRMLNHSRSGLFQDFKTHENAVVAAFKSKDPIPTAKRGIAAFKRKPKPEVSESLTKARSRDEAKELLKDFKRANLKELAKKIDIPLQSNDSVDKIKERIIESTVGFRLRSQAIRSNVEEPKAIAKSLTAKRGIAAFKRKPKETQDDESDRDQYGFRKPKLKQEQRGDLRVNLVPSDLAKRPAAADALQIGKKRRSIMGGNFTYDTQDPHEFTLQQYRDAHQYVYGDGHQMRQARKDSKAVDSVKANHEAKVRIALKQGKKVSSEVLKDYPNLRKPKAEAVEQDSRVQIGKSIEEPDRVKAVHKALLKAQEQGKPAFATYEGDRVFVKDKKDGSSAYKVSADGKLTKDEPISQGGWENLVRHHHEGSGGHGSHNQVMKEHHETATLERKQQHREQHDQQEAERKRREQRDREHQAKLDSYHSQLDDRVKSLSGEKGSIDIMTHTKEEGRIKKSIPATTYGDLAIHKTLDHNGNPTKPGYVVTHIASGLKLSEAATQQGAKRLVVGIHTTGANLGQEKPSHEEFAKIAPIVTAHRKGQAPSEWEVGDELPEAPKQKVKSGSGKKLRMKSSSAKEKDQEKEEAPA